MSGSWPSALAVGLDLLDEVGRVLDVVDGLDADDVDAHALLAVPDIGLGAAVEEVVLEVGGLEARLKSRRVALAQIAQLLGLDAQNLLGLVLERCAPCLAAADCVCVCDFFCMIGLVAN